MTFTNTLTDGLEAFLAQIPDAVIAALYQEAEAIMTDSEENYVPVEFGVLRDSGTVMEPEHTGTEISVSMGYGGASAAYALAVHETPSDHDPRSWRIAGEVHFRTGGSKYLERPFLDAANDWEDRLAARLKPLLGL